MDAAVVSLHGALAPAAASLRPPQSRHHQHQHAKPSRKQPQQQRAPLAVTARPVARSAAAPTAAVPALQLRYHTSSRAATGYAAALADASVRAGTLRRAARHARALLLRLQQVQVEAGVAEEEEEEDTRVRALVRMLVGKGKAGMVADVMAEFAAICDRLLLAALVPPARAHASY